MSVISIRDHGALDLVRHLLLRTVSVRIKVSGKSMRPLLRGGETVEIVPLDSNKPPQLGDILLIYDQQGNPLVHRLCRRYHVKHELYVQTKGDACAHFDTPVPLGQALGRVRCIIRSNHTRLDLQRPLIRLQSRLIVYRGVIVYTLRRAVKLIRKELSLYQGEQRSSRIALIDRIQKKYQEIRDGRSSKTLRNI